MIYDLSEMARTMTNAIDYQIANEPNRPQAINVMAWATRNRPETFQVVGQSVEAFNQAEEEDGGEGAYLVIDHVFQQEGITADMCTTAAASAVRAVRFVDGVDAFAFVGTLRNREDPKQKIVRVYCCTYDARLAKVDGLPVWETDETGEEFIVSIAWGEPVEGRITARQPFLAEFWSTYQNEVASLN